VGKAQKNMPNSADIQTLKAKLKSPVALVGMMGAGKSALGEALAQVLQIPFFDSDHEIEISKALSISAFFTKFGEDQFRACEEETLKSIAKRGVSVISTGGGALLRDQTRQFLQKHTIMVWLDVPADVLWDRVKNSTHRPLLEVDNPQDKLKTLMTQRQTVYQQAPVRLRITHETQTQALDLLINALLDAVNKDSF
jgi:shikimate kinase